MKSWAKLNTTTTTTIITTNTSISINASGFAAVVNNDNNIKKKRKKGLEDLEVGGRSEAIQMTALMWTARIPRRVQETWGELLSLKLQWKTIS